MRAWAALAIALAAASAALAQEPDDSQNGAARQESCPGVLTAPSTLNLGLCAKEYAYGGGEPETRNLAIVTCAIDKINKYQVKQAECLQKMVEKLHRKTLYPDSSLRKMVEATKFWRVGRTLKEELEKLACGWKFSPRTNLLRDLYVRPKAKLCKPSIEVVFGKPDGHPDADLQEHLNWTSVITHNLIQERTVGSEPMPISKATGPERTWQWIAEETVRDLATRTRTPGEAIRFGAQLAADDFRVRNNTLQLKTQALLVEQERREFLRRKKRLREAYVWWLLSRGAEEGAER